MFPLGILCQQSTPALTPALTTVVDYQFNGTDGATTTTDSTGNTTASGLGVVNGSSFANIFNNKLLARNNDTTIDDSGALSPYLVFASDFEIEVAASFNDWSYNFGEILWQLQNGSGAVLTLYAFVDGHIDLAANPLVLVGGNVASFPAGINLAAQQVIKVARVGSTISVYADGILKGTCSSTGTVNAGRIKFWNTNFERFVDYLTIKKA